MASGVVVFDVWPMRNASRVESCFEFWNPEYSDYLFAECKSKADESNAQYVALFLSSCILFLDVNVVVRWPMRIDEHAIHSTAGQCEVHLD